MKDRTKMIESQRSEQYPLYALRRTMKPIATRYFSTEKLVLLVILVMLVRQTGCNLFEQGLTHKALRTPLELEFYADRSQVAVGETVRMRFTVTNTSRQLWVSESKDTPVLDIIVEKPPFEQILMTWSSQNPDKALHRVEWRPGESKVLELQWVPDAEFRWGRLVHLTGTLSENSKIVQSAGVTICAGPACR